MKELSKNVFAMVLVSIMFIALLQNVNVKTAEAAEIYISVEDYSKAIANEINITAVNDSYAEGLKTLGIIREGEFSSYDDNITRGDAMVILARADEYLNGTEVTSELVQTAIDKRISDIGKVTELKRVDVAKAYLKGFMKGYSNGAYCTDRELKVTKKITKEGALSCIAMLKDKSKRAKISPDGQLIRTKNLPKTAKNYPYILESFPNEYYDWKFYYELVSRSQYNEKTGKTEKIALKNIVDYAKPADLDQIKDMADFSNVRKEKMDSWVNKAKTHMECIFNIDYRTTGEEWINAITSASLSNGISISEENEKEMLAKFLARAKENKTVIESSKIATDGSSMYYFDGVYYLRFYIRYRIVSSKTKYQHREVYLTNDLFYTNYPMSLNEYELGEWKECYFDVELDNHYNESTENLGVNQAHIAEEFYTDTIIK